MEVRPHIGQRRRIELIECHQTRMAVLIVRPDRDVILRGFATFQVDGQLGRILRISIDDGGDGSLAKRPDILIDEDAFDGLIEEDRRYGCDYCMTLHTPVMHDAQDLANGR